MRWSANTRTPAPVWDAHGASLKAIILPIRVAVSIVSTIFTISLPASSSRRLHDRSSPETVVGTKRLDQRQHVPDGESKTFSCALKQARPEVIDRPKRLEEFRETESPGRHPVLKGERLHRVRVLPGRGTSNRGHKPAYCRFNGEGGGVRLERDEDPDHTLFSVAAGDLLLAIDIVADAVDKLDGAERAAARR